MSRPPPDPVFVLRGSSTSVTCLKFLPQGDSGIQRCISGSLDGKLTIWNLKSMRPEFKVDGHPGKSVLELDILADGTILSHGRDGAMKLWSSAQNCTAVDTLSVPVTGFCKFSLLDGGASSPLLATAVSADSEVHIIDVKSKKVVHKATTPKDVRPGMCMCLKLLNHPTTARPYLFAGYEDGSVALWDVTASRMMSRCQQHECEPVMCIDADLSALYRGITGSADSKLGVFGINNSMGKLDPMDGMAVQLKAPGTGSVRIRQDAKLLAAGCWNGKIRIFSWKTMKPLAILSYHSGPINCLEFSVPHSPEDRLLAAGCKDGRISLWSIYTDK